VGETIQITVTGRKKTKKTNKTWGHQADKRIIDGKSHVESQQKKGEQKPRVRTSIPRKRNPRERLQMKSDVERKKRKDARKKRTQRVHLRRTAGNGTPGDKKWPGSEKEKTGEGVGAEDRKSES